MSGVTSTNPHDGHELEWEDEKLEREYTELNNKAYDQSMTITRFEDRCLKAVRHLVAFSNRSGLYPSLAMLCTSFSAPYDTDDIVEKAGTAACVSLMSLSLGSGEDAKFSWDGTAFTVALSLAACTNTGNPSVVLAAVSSLAHSTGAPLFKVLRQ